MNSTELTSFFLVMFLWLILVLLFAEGASYIITRIAPNKPIGIILCALSASGFIILVISTLSYLTN